MDSGTTRAADRFFRVAWWMAAVNHWCDAANGAEFQRVYDAWFEANCPFDVWSFIRESANSSSTRPS